MNAKDAKQLAIKKLREKTINEDVSDIIKSIEACANSGLFYTIVENINSNKQDKLKSMGYKIITTGSNDYPVISWE